MHALPGRRVAGVGRAGVVVVAADRVVVLARAGRRVAGVGGAGVVVVARHRDRRRVHAARRRVARRRSCRRCCRCTSARRRRVHAARSPGCRCRSCRRCCRCTSTVFVVCACPVAGLQVSVVQALLSLHVHRVRGLARAGRRVAGCRSCRRCCRCRSRCSCVLARARRRVAGLGRAGVVVVAGHGVRRVALPVAGLQVSVVQALLSLHVDVFVRVARARRRVAGSVVQALLSLHVTVFVRVRTARSPGCRRRSCRRCCRCTSRCSCVLARARSPGCRTSVVQALLSLHVTVFGRVALPGRRVAGVGRAGVVVVAGRRVRRLTHARSPGCRCRSCRRCCRCTSTVFVVSHWPVAGLQASVVQALLSLHVDVVPVFAQSRSPGCRRPSCRALLSVQGIGGKLQAAAPCARRIADVGRAEVVVVAEDDRRALRRVRARRPACCPGVSCATPPVYCAVAVMRPPTMSPAVTVYGMSALSMKSSAAVHPSAESVPPMHGTFGVDDVDDAVRRRQAERAARERAELVAVRRLLQRAR